MEQEHYNNSAIVCLRHDCDRRMIQLFRTDPTKCSVCNGTISSDNSECVTKIPCPFERASDIECDFVIALSAGQFGLGFETQSGMHIGICDSGGRVLEYDKDGILFNVQSRKNLIWDQCASLGFLNKIEIDIDADLDRVRRIWDETFESMRTITIAQPYDDNENNCLNFVQSFLCRFITLIAKEDQLLTNQQVEELTKRCSEKIEFCRHFVLSKTKQLARYIALNRRLQAGDKFMPS